MKSRYKAHFKEKGATMVEYAIMLAFIAIVVFAAVAALGTKTNALYEDAVEKYPS